MKIFYPSSEKKDRKSMKTGTQFKGYDVSQYCSFMK